VPNGFEFIFVNTIAGIIAICGFKHLYRRGQMFLSILLIYLAYCVPYLVLKLIQEGNFTSINWFFLVIFIINILLIIILYQFTFVFEKLFGFLSDSSLIELSDTNRKLLRNLAEIAPGTFQHSMQVANIAEAAIREVGGNVLLVRAGALYHDIGKMKNPAFFIENQTSMYNPHNNMAPEDSARVIIDHVNYGIELAHKHRLPEAIINFINSHHGKSIVRYFYYKYIEQRPEIDESTVKPLFTYPGNNPNTKETVVVMIADTAEATSRSLKQINNETINEMVDKLIDFKLNEGYFDDSDITISELTTIRKVIKRKLLDIHHSRVEYPELKNEK
jgi:putative nucleotidyltransferase with HDIG domain